jgi:molybdenum cofactor synthesis domain-containing protein
MAQGEVTAALLIIGNEILSGRTQDANLQYIALGLNESGIRLKEVRVVSDDEGAIIEAVNALRVAYDYVFTTGGIGPTHDDITTASIAKAFGVPVHRDQRTVDALARVIGPENLNEARLRMADVPDGAVLIENSVSRVPGYAVENVHVLAGVPRIMQAMFDGIRPRLKGGHKILSKNVTLHTSEGTIAAGLTGIQERRPDVEIGSYPFDGNGVFGTVIVVRGISAAKVSEAAREVDAMARALGVPTEDDGKPPA